MAVLDTGDLVIPTKLLDPWVQKIKHGSCIASLSNSIPMKFGTYKSQTFDIGEAEYVGEGAAKGDSTITPTTATITPFKFHKTVRWTEEVLWADEDDQLDVVRQILDLIQPALSRALDFGGFHGIDPTSGDSVDVMQAAKITGTSNVVELGNEKAYVYLDAADALVLASDYVPRDIALNPDFAAQFAALRGSNSEQKLYPNFRLSTEVSDLDGHRASVSRTVGAASVASTPTNVKAIVGDFDSFGWGVQRSIGLEVIRYGDPDGQGDLKRYNQVAFRAEVVYGWGTADKSAFAKIVDAQSS